MGTDRVVASRKPGEASRYPTPSQQIHDVSFFTRRRRGSCLPVCAAPPKPPGHLLVSASPPHHPMADFFVAQFLDEWSSSEGEKKGPPKYDRKCMEVDFMLVSSSPTLQCRGPAYPGDVKCRVADRLMNQHHNEFLRLRDWVDLGEGRRLVTDPHRLAHFMLRSREIVAAEVGACAPPKRLEHIKNPFLTKAQCRQCVRNGDLDVLTQRDKEVVQTRRAQLLGALHGLRMRDGGTVEATVAEIVCERLEKKTKRARE